VKRFLLANATPYWILISYTILMMVESTLYIQYFAWGFGGFWLGLMWTGCDSGLFLLEQN